MGPGALCIPLIILVPRSGEGILVFFLFFQFRHKSDNQVNNRQSQVLINGR